MSKYLLLSKFFKTRTNNAISALLVVILVLCTVLFSMSSAKAEELSYPTLDTYHKNNIIDPETIVYDSDGKITFAGKIYPESCYTIKQVSQPNNFTITSYAWSLKNQRLIPEYFEIGLKTKQYGTTTTTNTETRTYMVNVTNDGEVQITYSYDIPSDYSTKRIDTTIDSTVPDKIDTNFKGLSALNNGGAISNTKNIGDINGYFIGNYVNGSNSANTVGGAIYNYFASSSMGNITGHFIGNYVMSTSVVMGSAIYNSYSTIGHINGDFIENYVISTRTSDDTGKINGGAIHNIEGGVIGDITGNFIGNYSQSIIESASGGAIVNRAKIGNITGNFIENYGISSGNLSYGGAIANQGGEIGYILGSFIGNYNVGYSYVFGGAIANLSDDVNGGESGAGKIGYITGDFIENYITSETDTAVGGAIHNRTTLGNITGDFIGNSANGYLFSSGGAIDNRDSNSSIGDIKGLFAENSATSQTQNACGGAIANRNSAGSISSITGIFVANFVTAENSYVYGGAVYNYGIIGDITGDFKGNYIVSGNSSANGGALANTSTATMGNIKSNFLENTSTGSTFAEGGAIYNSSKIGNITGDFVANIVTSTGNSSNAYGGAIYNTGSIGEVESEFVENTANTTASSSGAFGGAICNTNIITKITGDFYGNYVSGTGFVSSGAIDNINSTGNIGDILGYFGENYAISTNGNAWAGAIGNRNNYSVIKSVTGDFEGNYVSANGYAQGGAIVNRGTIRSFYSDFTGNYVDSKTLYACGGAIYNENTIGDITGDFKYNYAKGAGYVSGGAIDSVNSVGNIGDIKGSFIGNYAISENGDAWGGAISNRNNYSTISSITGDFKGNYISAGQNAQGGAICNYGTIGKIDGDFIDVYATSAGSVLGGVIFNAGSLGNMETNFSGSYATGKTDVCGGVIYNTGTIGEKLSNGTVIGGIINTSFEGNYAESSNGTAQGGAVYTTTDLNFIANNKTVNYKGNYTLSGGTKDDNVIYVGSKDATITFDLRNDARVNMIDNIQGVIDTSTSSDSDSGSTGDGSDNLITSEYQSPYKSYGVNIQGDDVDSTLFYMPNDMNNATLSMGNTTISTINNDVHVYNVNNLTVTSNTGFVADVDLKNETMDRFVSNGYGEHTGNLMVRGMNLISDAPKNTNLIEVYFAQRGLKDNVVKDFTHELPSDKHQTTLYTPTYKYELDYENREDGGYFVFRRGNGSSTATEDYDSFNPAVVDSPVTAQAGVMAVMNETYHYVFEHADAFTQLPRSRRMMAMNQNQYASASTDFNQNMTYNYNDPLNRGAWVRPFANFENVHLKNGPRADVISYGTLAGFDTEFHKMKHGWTNVGTGYIGYTGSIVTYGGTSTTTNGGLLGFTETFYRKNFWTALTVSAGASTSEASNMYGHEDFTTLCAGVASKTGYNFEFKDGKFIIQPVWFMSYTFVDTFDYTNSAGVRIKSDPMHTIQLNPSVRFIGNLKNGWQPYLSVGMVWNLMNETNFTADGAKLPEMHIRPYVEYGLGLQRVWADRFTAFGQAMVRNGGRNGIALTCGFRWTIGRDGKTDTPSNKNLKKSVGFRFQNHKQG